MMGSMGDIYKLAEWTDPELVGFEALDLSNYRVAEALTPHIQAVMHEIERWDRLCVRVTLQGEVLQAVAATEGAFQNPVEIRLPPGLLQSMLDWSNGPCPPWPVPEPPPEVLARLNKLDEVLFDSAGEGLGGVRAFLNVTDYLEVRKWRHARMDHITQASLLRHGWQATFYGPKFDPENEDVSFRGTALWISRLVPAGFVYLDRSDMHGALSEAPPEDQLIPLGGP